MNTKIGLLIIGLFYHSLTQAFENNPLPALYKKLLPSVVTLHTFENEVMGNTTRVVTTPNGLGSGVIISNDGIIITASHVVHTVDALQVEFETGEFKKAKVLSSIIWGDLAMIQVDALPENVKPAQLGDSNKVQIGEKVFVIGAPQGLIKTLTVGYISGKHPVGSRPAAPMAEFFQTDAAINPGNSGGPLFNMAGEIIGIASHIQSHSGGSEGLGFTVTSETVKELLLSRGHFWSGMVVSAMGPELADAFQLPQDTGALIQKVASGSLAFKAGLQGGTIHAMIEDEPFILGGDIILSIDGNRFDSKSSLNRLMKSIKSLKSGDRLHLVIWRKGRKKKIDLLIP